MDTRGAGQVMSNLTVLGNKVDGTLTKEQLEFFPAPPHVDHVKFETHEFTSLCPVTNQPDLYTVIIEYSPNGRCVESKSLKLYLGQWRNKGIFGEAITAQIASDLFEVLDAGWVEVKTIQQARGGLVMTAVASRSKGLDKEYIYG